jgi:predicted nucleic acid-binding protein
MNAERQLLDTNILVHAYVVSDGRKHAVAKEIIERVWMQGNGLTTLQNLCEFFFVVTEKVERPIAVERAERIVRAILTVPRWQVLDRGEATILRATELVRERRVPFWDALIAATMLENEIDTILTENTKDFQMVRDLWAINPFRRR